MIIVSSGVIVGLLVDVFMNLDTFLVHRDIGQLRIGPTARIVVFDAVFFAVHSFMRMSAKNSLRAMKARVQQRSSAYRLRKPQPTGIRPIRKPRKWLALQ